MARFLSQYGYLLAYFLFLFLFMLKSARILPEKLVIKFLLLFYIALFTFRDISVGFDYHNYFTVFQLSENLSITQYFRSVSNMEPGYLFLNKCCMKIVNDVRFFQFVIASTYCAFLYHFIIRYSKIPLFTLYLYYASGCLFSLMNITRSALACAVCLGAFMLYHEGKWKRGILLNLLACSIHTIAVTGFLCLYVFRFHVKINRNRLMTALLLTGIGTCFFNLILPYALMLFPKYLGYFDSDKRSIFIKSGSVSYMIVFVFIFLLAITQRRGCIRPRYGLFKIGTDNDAIAFDAMLWLNILGILVSVFSMRLSMIGRFMYLPLHICPVLISMAITSISRMENKLSSYFAVATAFFGYSFIYLYIAENHMGRDGIVPYLLMGVSG